MLSRAASLPREQGMIPISNHSYGRVSGWVYTDWSGTLAYHWTPYHPWGDASTREANFGQYDGSTATYDDIAYNAPYYLIFKSAGNDRNDNPSAGSTVYYSTDGGSSWTSVTYNAASHPPGDGVYKAGYDTIPHRGVAKNVMCVGAVNDAVSGSTRSLAGASIIGFSGWGPADDGRIKPDIVANGASLYSTDDDHNSDYTWKSGTSMSSPNACGSALLLVDYFDELMPGHAMRASTLKGLIVHTADDLPSASPNGPDYAYGWGLMNTKAAADHLKDWAASPANQKVVEGRLAPANTSDTYTLTSAGAAAVRVTLCWTDPPGMGTSTHDDTTVRLVNDLDLVVTGPGGTPTNYPYVLDRANPSTPATTGENDIDNVEQVYIASPGAGTYTIAIDYDGTLTDDEQWYSLLVSGGQQTVAGPAPTITSIGPTSGAGVVSLTVDGANIQLGANVTFKRIGWPDIEATGELVSPETIVAEVSLTNAAAGLWDVRVTNPDGQYATLAESFEVISLVYEESFENGSGIWTHSAGNDFDWTRDADGTPSTATGPSGASDGDWYIYTEASGNNPNKVAAIESEHDFSDVPEPALSFDYHMYGNSMGTLNLDVYDGSWDEAVWSETGQKHDSTGAAWSNAVVDLSGYAGMSGIKLRFRGITGTGYNSDMAVDNVKIYAGAETQTVTLAVASSHGMASPSVGTHTNIVGTVVTCEITNAFVAVATAQSTTVYTCTGWTGTGDVPSSGTSTNTGPLVLTTNSSITWAWAPYDMTLSNQVVTLTETNVAINRITAGDGYEVDAGGNVTLEAGNAVRLLPGFHAVTGSTFRARINP